MRDDLDHLISRLADGRPDRSLAGFEHAVLQGVARRREDIQAARAGGFHRRGAGHRRDDRRYRRGEHPHATTAGQPILDGGASRPLDPA